MKAIWNNIVIAETDQPIKFEGDFYFPYDSVKLQYMSKSGKVFSTPTRGVCEYYDIEVGGVIKKDGAWMCFNPRPGAQIIANCFAFDKEVQISHS